MQLEIAKKLNGGRTLRVVTAMSLSEHVMAEWCDRLGRALGHQTAIVFDVDAALLAGVERHFPNAILRLSWQSALTAMRAEIESHENAR